MSRTRRAAQPWARPRTVADEPWARHGGDAVQPWVRRTQVANQLWLCRSGDAIQLWLCRGWDAVQLWARRNVWLLSLIVIALLVSELPRFIAVCCAPPGATGLGTAWFVNDFAQYESAMRQGAEQPGWLIHDPFTAEPHQPAFMFPLYVGIGKLSAALQVPSAATEQVVEVVARVLLVLALWRFCRAFARGRLAARWGCGLALFASGFELFALPFGGYTGNWSYELNGFGLLFAAPHVPLAMAATLEMARDGLRPSRARRPRWLSRTPLTTGLSLARPPTWLSRTPLPMWLSLTPRPAWLSRTPLPTALLKVALLSAVVSLLHPFHAPVLLGAMGLAGLVSWRIGRGIGQFASAIVAAAAALPILLPTVLTFSFDPFWVTTYTSQNLLPSPAPHELLVDLGATLLLALGGVAVLRGRVARFGLVLWLLLALIAMYLPVPYQRRLAFGVQPILAVLAANFLAVAAANLSNQGARIFKQVVVGVAASSTVVVLVSMLASGIRNAPLPIYRSTTDLDAAANWLESQASPGQVILADWEAANYLAPRTLARVYGGHPVATLHPDQKEFAVDSMFAHPDSLAVARTLGGDWLVYGPAEAQLSGPGVAPVFQSGAVRVYAVRR